MLPHTPPPSLSVNGLRAGALRNLLQPVEPALQKIMSFDRLREVYGLACRDRENAAMPRLLELLGIRCEFGGAGLSAIPATGQVIVVANHPFGLLEGAILAAELPKLRPDVRFLANSMLAGIPGLRERCIFVDPFGERDSVPGNASALKECVSWLRGGGLLVAFPAGEVAHFRWKEGCVSDPRWNPAIARIAQRTGAVTVPIFFHGANSLTFQLAGTVHPRLRTMSLPRELLNKQGRRIQIRVGLPVSPACLRGLGDSRAAVEYLRCRTCVLGAPESTPNPLKRIGPALRLRARRRAAIVPAVPPAAVAGELERLARRGIVCESHDLAVVLGSAPEMPNLLREIGRLREISFRGAGEGTGRALDLDRFDAWYQHLILWNRKTGEVVGAYRMGATADILPRYGIGGLYTSTLFRFRRGLFDELGPAIELGRSFIRPEYQKQFAPLMLLWKGIVRYAAGRPGRGVLFGGVSISSAYHPVSRHLIVSFLSAHRAERLQPLVAPRHPYRPESRLSLDRVPADIEEVSALVSGIESDGKGVPILVKQYHRAGGKVLGFNVDRNFSNALDALITVDLRTAPRNLVERYLGREESTAFSLRAPENSHPQLLAGRHLPA